jgi:hypothetical protein
MLPILWEEIGAGLGPPALGALSACQRIAAWRGPSTPKRSPEIGRADSARPRDLLQGLRPEVLEVA